MLGSIAFICIGNTCRSVLAEHILKRILGDEIKIGSYGVAVKEEKINRKTQETLYRQLGVDVSYQKPTQLDTILANEYATLIILDKIAVEYVEQRDIMNCRIVFWEIPDPYNRKISDYQKTYLLLEQKITELVQNTT